MITLRNKLTGGVIELDARAARISRMRKRCYAWAGAMKTYLELCGEGKYRLMMLTLTYRGYDAETGEMLPDFGWKPNQIRDFMQILRRHCGERLISYAWVAELQQRGAVHYHVLILVKPGTKIPYPDAAGWWPHGMTRIETARTPFYVMKYAQKGQFQEECEAWKVFPKGLRLFAVWIAASAISDFERWKFRLTSLPAWLVETVTEFFFMLIPKRQEGGGWIIEDMTMGSILLPSPYEVVRD